MKKVLLASTALAGASLLATSATAGTPIVGDNQEVSISGFVRFSIHAVDQEIDNGNRGYVFQSDDNEVIFNAQAVADNGLEFGLSIEIQTQTNDTINADEAWIFLQYEGAGRLELGDQDGAADRMVIEGKNAMAGRGGYDGDVGKLFNFGAANRTGTPQNNVTGDATKITYFTPRFGGFQVGASFTPDTGDNGSVVSGDVNGNFENVVSLGANFQQTFNNVGVTVAIVGEFGDAESVGGGVAAVEDVEVYVVGAKIDFAGFSVAAGYGSSGDTGVASGNTGDAGEVWDVGAKYGTGPWNVGAGAAFSEQDLGAGRDIEVDIYSIGADFTIAPGLVAKTDLNFVDVEDDGAADNDGITFVFALDAAF